MLDFLGLEPLPASLDDPLIADLRIDRRGRHDQVVEQDGQLVLECLSFLGEMLASELAEPPAPCAVELEADGGLEPLVGRGVGPRAGTCRSRSAGPIELQRI